MNPPISPDKLTDARGSVVQNTSFDAWGRRRNPSNWTYSNIPATLFSRGYTGHSLPRPLGEHLDLFGLINMNGRVYDPILARFLSVDNFVQAPDYSQNYNRYSYCLNNPLKHTDPTGEIIIIDDWIVGFFKGLFDKNKDENAWQSANRHAKNSAKIWAGLFAADTDRPGWGWQIVSRLTWQAPQTLLGFSAAHAQNMLGQVKKVGYCEGATVVTNNGDKVFFNQTDAYTLGSYIIGDEDLNNNVNNALFQHEYGHYLQSQASGLLYLPTYAIASAFNPFFNGGYTDLSEWTEQDAQARSLLYFAKYVDGFTYGSWNYRKHPFYKRPDGREVYWKFVNQDFLLGKLKFPQRKNFLSISHVDLISGGASYPNRTPYMQ